MGGRKTKKTEDGAKRAPLIFTPPATAGSMTARVEPDGGVSLLDGPGAPYLSGLDEVTYSPTGEAGFQGTAGPYRVTFVLGVPALTRPVFHLQQAWDEADSLLKLGDPDTQISLTIGEWTLQAKLNGAGRLGMIECDVEAVNLMHAQGQAHEVIMPVLSALSLEADVPLSVSTTYVEDLTIKTARAEMRVAGEVRTLQQFTQFPMSAEMLRLSATYREALNSVDEVHEALSYLRIMEGIKVWRTKRATAAHSVGAEARKYDERIPLEADLAAMKPIDRLPLHFARVYAGQSFGQVRDDIWNQIRNSLAHGSPDLFPLATDSFSDLTLLRQLIPILRYMAREQLLADRSMVETW